MSKNTNDMHTDNSKMTKRNIIISIIIILLAVIFCISIFKIEEIEQIAMKLLSESEVNMDTDTQTESQTELISLNLEVKNETDTEYVCLLTFTSNDENNKIKSIEYPAREGNTPEIITVEDEEGKNKISVDYKIIKKDEDKTFNITTIDGRTYAKRTGYRVTYKNGDEIFKIESRLLTQTIPITNTFPIKEGKHFIGYSVDKQATVADYFEGGLAQIDKDVTLYAIYTEPQNGYKENIENDSLIGKVSKIDTSGLQEITVNGVTYSANVIVENNDLVLDGEKQVQGATLTNKIYEFGDRNQDVATENENAKNMVILKVNGNLTVNSNVTLTACKSANGYGGPKGLFIYCTGTFANNGTIDMTARGAKAEGEDVYLWQNAVYEDDSKKYEYIPAIGGNGASAAVSSGRTSKVKGKNGINGNARQTGGGGSGAAKGNVASTGSAGTTYRGSSGSGSSGTSYSGGTGGGAIRGRDGSDGAMIGNGGNAKPMRRFRRKWITSRTEVLEI